MELTLDAYWWPPLLHPPRRVGPRRDPPPREDLIALSALAVEDAGRRLNPRCRGGSPGQVDPDSKPPWWRLANLRHPRATPRAHLHRRCCSVPPLQRSSMAGSAAPRREPCRVPSSPAPRHRSQQAAPPSLCASPSWRTGSSRIRPLSGGRRCGHPPQSHHLPGGIRTTSAWAHRYSTHPPSVSLSNLRASVEEEREGLTGLLLLRARKDSYTNCCCMYFF